ncbi:MAG: glycosyltransferase [Candidatus Kapabacteria bacterium]|nr:glycosyltransferase [Ignavibacteriota bacterium]MCW5883434.1 glycosyltransferase [Candidatus Kapabacteria bacterium]
MKLSVVTICFNEVSTIQKTIESVIKQNYTDFEYIIIDGGSTDGTMNIVNQYKNVVSRIISEKDEGIFFAMNKSLDLAIGEFIYFLNAGDFLVNNYIFSEIFEIVKSEDLIYGDVIFVYESGLKFRRRSPKTLKPEYFFIDSINHQTTFIKLDLIKKAGGFDTSFKIAGDYDLILKLVYQEKCKTKYIEMPVSYFNLSGISSNSGFNELQNEERAICLKRYFDADTLEKLRKKKFISDIINKKIKYSYSLILSNLSNNFLFGKK